MRKHTLIRKTLHLFVAAVFLCSGIIFPFGGKAASAQVLPTVAGLPIPGTMVGLTSGYQSPVLVGLKIHPENPLLFDFIVDMGSSNMAGEELKAETEKLIKYFLAALTIPEKEVWVNLSPYEKDRIVPDTLGQTVMGKTMLEQDYILKQLAASLTDPKEKLGQEFWGKVRTQVKSQLGDAQVPMNTFNKVWIVPEKAQVLENKDVVVIGQRRLKVMMEQDYLAMEKDSQEKNDQSRDINMISSQVFKNTILPHIEKEVNEGKNFTAVRQIYNSVILATWYKQALMESFLGKVYADKGKVAGIETDDKEMKQKIYEQYVAAFKKGVYSLIQEEEDSATGDLIPRKYFSGGLEFVASSALDRQYVDFETMSPMEINRIMAKRAGILDLDRSRFEDSVDSGSGQDSGDSGSLRQVVVQMGDAGRFLEFRKFLFSTGRTVDGRPVTETSGITDLAYRPYDEKEAQAWQDTAVPNREEAPIGENIKEAAIAIAKAGPEAQKRFEYHFKRFVAIQAAYKDPESDRKSKITLLISQLTKFMQEPLLQSPDLNEFYNKFQVEYEAARKESTEDAIRKMERIVMVMRLMSNYIRQYLSAQIEKNALAEETPAGTENVAPTPEGTSQSEPAETAAATESAVQEVFSDKILIDLLQANEQPVELDKISAEVRGMMESLLAYARAAIAKNEAWSRTTPLALTRGVSAIRLEDEKFSDQMTKIFNPNNEVALQNLGFGINTLQFTNPTTFRSSQKPALTFSSNVRKIIDSAARASAAVVKTSQADVQAAQVENVGGIDFDASKIDLEIKRDGNGIMLPISQQNWENINVEGLVPVILNISPIDVKNLPMYLGQNSSETPVEQRQAPKDAS